MAPYQRLEEGTTETDASSNDHHCGASEIALAVIGLTVLIVGYIERQYVEAAWSSFLLWCEGLGWGAAVLISCCCCLSECICFPAFVFFVGAGGVFQALYGTEKGFLVGAASCAVGTWIGCNCAFLLGKTVLKPKVEKKINEMEALRIINQIIANEGWRFAFLMRLSPFLPMELFNFACSMTPMTLSSNMVASLGSLPMCVFEVYGAAMAAGVANGDAPSGKELYISIAVDIFAIILLVFLVWYGKKKYDAYVADAKLHEHEKKLVMKESNVRSMLRKGSTLLLR